MKCRAGKIILLAERSLSKHEDLSSIPSIRVHACNPGADEAETGVSLGFIGQPT